MNYWKKNGAPAEKLMVGFGAYARTFTLSNPSNHGLDAPTSGPGRGGAYTQAAGTLAYFEVKLWHSSCSDPEHWLVIMMSGIFIFLIIAFYVLLMQFCIWILHL